MGQRRVTGAHVMVRSLVMPMTMVCILLVMGVVFGSVAVRTLDQAQKNDLVDYLGRFSDFFLNESRSRGQAITIGVVRNIEKIGLIWVLGVSVVGALGILPLVFVHGFAAGFTIAFLIEELSFKGLAFALASIIPQNMLLLPGILVSGAAGIGHAWSVVTASRTGQPPISARLLVFTLICIGCGLLVIGAAVVEGLLTPLLVRLVKPAVF